MGVRAALDRGQVVWDARGHPDQAFGLLARWIGEQYADPRGLYRAGRALSVVVGVSQLFLVAWMLGQWGGPRAVTAGTIAAALSPVVVLHSQYVLADIWGLLFITIVAGLAARPTPNRVLWMAAVAGLAAASKFHYGIWLLTALLCVPRLASLPFRQRVVLACAAAAVFAAVVVALVPWFWINPFLAAKEFAGVVLVKVGVPGSERGALQNFIAVGAGLGALAWAGVLPGVLHVRRDAARLGTVLVPAFLALVTLASSATVSDRYGLVLVPGVLVLAALGWERLLGHPSRTGRLAAQALLVLCVAATAVSLARAERRAGETDVDVLVQRWVLQHVPRNARVAIHAETNAFLPRSRLTLENCAAVGQSVEALREKWRAHGIPVPEVGSGAMQLVVLNDELFHAYWCRRELAVLSDEGFEIVPYHREPRFGAVDESTAIRQFAGHAGAGPELGVLVMNRPAEVGVRPAAVLRTRRGQRLIYVRPDLLR